jgi:tripartite-type tricarboxylate transporter receptor subunit TctC
MNKNRPALIAALALTTTALSAGALAQSQERRQIAPNFPNKPIRLVTTVAAGGGLDFITRTVAATMSQRLGSSVIVENMAGGNGVLAVNATINSAPDGYFVLSTGGSIPINTVFKKFERDIRTALVPVSQTSVQPYVMYMPASSPINNIRDLVAYAKKNPGKLNYGSTGVGSVVHMGLELLEFLAGIDMVHVPYKGSSAALLDVTSGRLDIHTGTYAGGVQLLKAGKIKAVGVTSTQRVPDLPNVPTVAESGFPNYELGNTYALYVNGATPAVIVNALNREVIASLNDPELKKKFAQEGSSPAPAYTPDQLKKILVDEIDRWEAVVKSAGIKLDD